MHENQFLWFDKDIKRFLQEDDWGRNAAYFARLPEHLVTCTLKLKSPGMVAGLPFFLRVFSLLGAKNLPWEDLRLLEGKSFDLDEEEVLDLLSFSLPFSLALNGERLALNLCQRASRIATSAHHFSRLAKDSGVEILDTRKTTPGLRALEKYAVQIGGGANHRFGQNDAFMIKDNHKTSLGGIAGAVRFFRSLKSFYTPIIVEIHDPLEIAEARSFGLRHFLLDNFSPAEIKNLVAEKKAGETFEASGGITQDNLEQYLIPGLDAVSMGALTYDPMPVDLSFKFKPLS